MLEWNKILPRISNNNNACYVYFDSILFDRNGGIIFYIDIVHAAFLARIHQIAFKVYPYNIFHPWTEALIESFVNLLTVTDIEEGKEVEVKFMNSEDRENNKELVDFLVKKFEVVKDNGIILTLKKRQLNDNDTGFSNIQT